MSAKFAIVIPDGCADEPQTSLGGRTPLQAARTPHMDRVARFGSVGLANHTPDGFTPGSDVATLSLFGYDPHRYLTGRAPLEAAAMQIPLGPHDWAARCNLVTVLDGRMVDFSGGHVSTAHGREYMETVREHLTRPGIEFHAGVSYRNIMVCRGTAAAAPFTRETKTQPPHDIPDQATADYLPRGPGSELLRELMHASSQFLCDHPLNAVRRAQGEHPVTQVWLWGQGQAPNIPHFADRFKRRGAIVTAVDLLRGIGTLIGWQRIDVPTATGYLDTDYAAKGRAGVRALADFDLVCVHVEATDEASHEGRADAKVEALERIDEQIVGPLWEALRGHPQWRILVSPDHPTFLQTRVHTRGSVPWAIAGTGVAPSGLSYDEFAAKSGPSFDPGHTLMSHFLEVP